MSSLLDQVLALDGRTREDLAKQAGPLARVVRAEGIEHTPELDRVLALDRRPESTDELVRLLSAALRLDPNSDVCPVCRGTDETCRTCGGTGRIELRPRQAEALREAFELRGLFAPMRVGSGKTLVTLLLPTLLGSQRPVLMIPASLRDEKTPRDFAALRKAWRVRLPVLVSYQEMGRPDREHRLAELAPDLLILDEVGDKARNWESAVTRRIHRYIEATHVPVACLSGTMITDALLDYHHMAVWALRDRAPVPVVRAEAERWSKALDRDVGAVRRVAPGALASIPGGFHGWLRGSRGVVPTPGSDCDASIEISTWSPTLSEQLQAIIARTEESGVRPDGEILDEWELPDCLCQLSLGFFYVWDPLPPDWWLYPRRGWRAYARAVLDEHLPGFDSESQIVRALDQDVGPMPPAAGGGWQLLEAWRGVRDKFTPNPVPRWIDPGPLEQAAERTRADRSIAWVRYRAAGGRLEDLGVPYYGGGTDPESARPGSPVALSIAAHSTGRNLQAWASSLVLTPIANASGWEQLIGRTHRAGQRADVVRVSIIAAIEYQGAVLGRVMTEARAISRASGFSQKLVDATWV